MVARRQISSQSLQIGAKFRSMLISKSLFLFECLVDTALEISGRARIPACDGTRFSIENRIEDNGSAWAGEGLIACRHFIQQQTEREEIRPTVYFFRPRLFRRHVSDSAYQRTGGREISSGRSRNIGSKRVTWCEFR